MIELGHLANMALLTQFFFLLKTDKDSIIIVIINETLASSSARIDEISVYYRLQKVPDHFQCNFIK